MNTMRHTLWVAMAIAVLCMGAYAQSGRPYVGVMVDSNPLGALLMKHLRLESGQGVRIQNVVVDSPADKAGLEPDDIIVTVQGQNVASGDSLVKAFADEAAGATIQMEIIHLGQRQTLELTLEVAGPYSHWKYPFEPGVVTTWQPGRIWQRPPGGQGWTQVPFQSVPLTSPDVSRLFQRHYTYYGGMWPDTFTITVEGDPNDGDSRVVVRARDGEHTATVGTIETLPEKYQAPAGEALKGAIQAARLRPRAGSVPMPEPPDPDQFNQYFQNMNPWSGFGAPPSDNRDRTLERIEEQLERLAQRMEQLEQRYKDSTEGANP